METLGSIWTVLLTLDTVLEQVVAAHGDLVYALIWLTLFAETGFVVTVFLPGETLLLSGAALAGRGTLSVWPLLWGGIAATFCGDMLNFAIGRWLRRGRAGRIGTAVISPAQMETAKRQLARHGAAAIVLARFMPVLRAMAPLAGGMAGMAWKHFAVANALGKVVWVGVYVAGGYYLGSIPWFVAHFPIVILAAAAIPVLLAGVRWAMAKFLAAPPRP